MLEFIGKPLTECTLEELEIELEIMQVPFDGVVTISEGRFIFCITHKLDEFGEYDFEECGYIDYSDSMGDVPYVERYLDKNGIENKEATKLGA